MNRTVRWGLALALLPLAACADTKPPAPPAPPPAPPPIAANDASFIQTAAQGGMAEVQMGQLADSTSHSKAIKAFAEKMVSDHTANDDQLKQLVTAKGGTVPTTLGDDQQAMLTKLQGEHGHKFDHDYLQGQIQGHQAMLSAFQTEASSGTDPDVKNFATQTIPTIQMHLDRAKALAGMGGMHHHHMMHHPKADAS
ncbi:DUF4142 domain-containing protein [Lichenicoccus sp.]|uniref:DUF4142 domain-containing protein n=1 Tax=Lichenicoccus sp. TaxID=2781899 RepID=UPI003D0A8198